MASSGRKAQTVLDPNDSAQSGSIGKRSHRGRKSNPQNYLHAAAHSYHELGLPITICQGKTPWQTDWPDLNWTPAKIDSAYRFRPAANVGIVLGPRSGLVDFECDGADSEATLLELFGGDIPDAPTWRSRRGLHRLFRWHPTFDQLG